ELVQRADRHAGAFGDGRGGQALVADFVQQLGGRVQHARHAERAALLYRLPSERCELLTYHHVVPLPISVFPPANNSRAATSTYRSVRRRAHHRGQHGSTGRYRSGERNYGTGPWSRGGRGGEGRPAAISGAARAGGAHCSSAAGVSP